MKSILGGSAVVCLLVVFSIAVFSQDPFKTTSSAQKNNIPQAKIQSVKALRPGEALIKKSDKKTAINVLFINYRPIKSGSLKVDVYNSKSVLLASQTEDVKKINETATACVYVDNSANTQTLTAVLNGAGFKNKRLSYAES
jgi:hypothetical protein